MWPFRFAMHKRRGLRNMVVYLLSSSPKNGVELMDGVEAMTRGWWRPTPGSIYPLLKDMTDHGVVIKREDGRYELTPHGKRSLEDSFGPPRRQPQSMDDMVGQIQSFLSCMEDMKGARKERLDPLRGKFKELAKRFADLAEGEDGGS